MKSIMLVTPVYRRFDLTRLMLLQRMDTILQAAAYGVRVGCVCIGDWENLAIARMCGFHTIEAPNILGSKYNDGHQYAYEDGWDISFQVNSDQVFDPELLLKIADSPDDKIIESYWLTAVHKSGTKALTYQNPLWSMLAYPRQLLAANPRPCEEQLMSMCDTSVRQGVLYANRDKEIYIHKVESGPLEVVQFESEQQLTPWKRNEILAARQGISEHSVPWEGISLIHGEPFTMRMQDFYGI